MSKANGIITDRIIASLEQGTIPWRKPWSIPDRGEFQNAISGHRYRGINTVILAMTANANGYTDPRWITFKQARENGGSVRKGEKGTPVVFWNWIEREDEDGETKEIPFLRYYTVFNVEQCDNLELPSFSIHKPKAFDPLDCAESIAQTMPNRPPITHDGGNRAFYRPLTDSIHLPVRDWFESANGFYATLFHELGHSTGHPDRLNRKSIDDVAPFGSENYSREELVAEFTSAFLCGTAGIVDQQLEQSAAYIASWLRVLKNDDRAVVIAAAQAQKAADYILAGNELAGEPAVGETPQRPAIRIHFPHRSTWEYIARQPVYVIAVQNLIRNVWRRVTRVAPTSSRNGDEFLTPGKDHRRTLGKATFSGKGAAIKCTSVAYWGTPIRKALTPEEHAGVTVVTRIAHALGARTFPVLYDRNRRNVGVFAPSFYVPAERCVHGEVVGSNCNDCRTELAKAA